MKKAEIKEIENLSKPNAEPEYLDNVHKQCQHELSTDVSNICPKEETEADIKGINDQRDNKDNTDAVIKNQPEEFTENIYDTIDDYLA